MKGQRVDLKGRRFGRLVAVADVGAKADGSRLWHCECDCGGYAKVPAGSLSHGNTRSCGCLRRDVSRAHGFDYVRNNGMMP